MDLGKNINRSQNPKPTISKSPKSGPNGKTLNSETTKSVSAQKLPTKKLNAESARNVTETCFSTYSEDEIQMPPDQYIVIVPGVGDYFTEVLQKPIKDIKTKLGAIKIDFYDDKASNFGLTLTTLSEDKKYRTCSSAVWSFFVMF